MKALLSGSGSGGHIYPCIALYKYLKNNNISVDCIIFKDIDEKIYKQNDINYIKVEGNSSNKVKKIKDIFKNNKYDFAITFGGKNSIYICLIATFYKVPYYIFEQNRILGRANKVNYHFANAIFSNFKLKKDYKKEVNIGNPNMDNKSVKKLNLFHNNNKIILITMGSQGSSSIDLKIKQFIKDNNHKYNIIYVTGLNVTTSLKQSDTLKIFSYYNNQIELINYADIIITRAGASTLSEIITFNKLSIVIPSPYVKDDHQNENATYLKNLNTIFVINENTLNKTQIENAIAYLLNNKETIKNNIKKIKKERVCFQTLEVIKHDLLSKKR